VFAALQALLTESERLELLAQHYGSFLDSLWPDQSKEKELEEDENSHRTVHVVIKDAAQQQFQTPPQGSKGLIH
jgi:hypothetical protein